MEKTQTIHYQECKMADLSDDDRRTIASAIEAADRAYAPYSHFHVGAALRLGDGSIVSGSNQENIAYPSGLCAERTAMFAASSQHPHEIFDTLAVVGRNPEGDLVPASPCGACRQVMSEYEQRQQKKMRILIFFSVDKIVIIEGVDSLLPFSFTM